jgi:hypothetical protein
LPRYPQRGGDAPHYWTNENNQQILVHVGGNQIDIKMVTADGNKTYGPNYNDANSKYDAALNKELIQMIADYRGEVQATKIFFSDPNAVDSSGLTKALFGHGDHIHVEFGPG